MKEQCPHKLMSKGTERYSEDGASRKLSFNIVVRCFQKAHIE